MGQAKQRGTYEQRKKKTVDQKAAAHAVAALLALSATMGTPTQQRRGQ